MRKIVERSAILLLMTLAAACQKQDANNLSGENTYVSDETGTDNLGQFDNLASPAIDAANESPIANTN